MRMLASTMMAAIFLAAAPALQAQTTVTVGEGATVTLESTTGETTMKVENNAIVDVKGRLRLAGTDSTFKSRVDGITANTDKYTVIIENGGELDANYFHFDQLARGGVRVRSGGKILQLNNGTFDNQVDEGGVYLNLGEMTAEWTDTFNSLTPKDPVVAGDITNWTIAYDDGNGLNELAIVNTYTTEGRGNVIKFTDNDSGSAPVPDNASMYRTFGGASGYTRGYAEFKMRFGSTAEYGKVNFYNAAGTLFYTLKFGEDLNPNTVRGTLSGAAADDVYLPSGSYSANRWYKVRVTWDVSAAGASSDKWNVWIDGVHKGTLNYTSPTDCSNIAKIEFATDEATTVTNGMYVDDVSIVPLTASDPVAVVFEDTISGTAGATPTGWTNGGTINAVVNADAVYDTTNPNTGAGNMIKFADASGANACVLSRQIASSTSVDLRKGYLEFKIRKSNIDANEFLVKLTDTGVGSYTMKFEATNITGNGTTSQTYQAYSAITWYKVRIEWDFQGAATADVWTVWVNDLPKGTVKWSAGTTDFTGIDTISFETTAASQTTVYVDDVRLGELDFLDGSARDNVAYSFNNVSFANTGARTSIYNVKASAATPVAWFLGGSGAAWGATYESDPWNRIRWSGTDATAIVGRYNQAGVLQTSYNNFGEAIAAATAGQRLKLNRNITMGEAVKLTQDDLSVDVAIEGGVFIPMGGRYVSGTYTPDRAASGYQELLASVPPAFDSGPATTNPGTVTGATSTSAGVFSKALFFDGNDYVSVGDHADFNFGAATDFTVEAWFRTTAAVDGNIVTKLAAGDSGAGYRIYYDYVDASNRKVTATVSDGTDTVTLTSTTATLNDGRWHHVALVADRDGNANLYIDGTSEASGSMTVPLIDSVTNAVNLGIGANSNGPGNYLTGWIDEVRISNNLRYTANFTVASSAFSSDANTMGLWQFNGSILKDNGGSARHGYLSNTTTQNPTGTTSGKFGNAYSFDGSDFVTVDDNAVLDGDFATADFTVEAWVYISNLAAPGYVVEKFTGGAGYRISYDLAQTFTATVNGVSATSAAIGAIGWYHVALVADRDTDVRIYVNGAQTTTAGATGGTIDTAALFVIGADSAGTGNFFTGRIDEMRVSAGANALRYTAAFDATRLQPFTPEASTKALYHFGETYITLRNAVVARGGIDVVKAQNCTLFRSESTWPALAVTQSALINTIVESNATLTGTSYSDAALANLATWISSGTHAFNNLAMLDFHIKADATGLADVIDRGNRLDNIVYDAAVPALDTDSTARGYDGNATPNNPVAGDWDIGADEYYAASSLSVLATTGTTEIGNIRRIFPAGSRNGVAISYAVTAGGSSNTESYDNRLIVLRIGASSTFNVEAASVPAPGAIVNLTYFRATSSPHLVYIYLVIDTDNDGYGDSIMALVDTGNSTIAADTAFDTDTVDDGVQYWGSPLYTIATIRIAGEEDAQSSSPANDPRRGRKLYFVAGQKFYKVNCDPGDADDDADQKYGEAIWSSSDRKFAALGTLNIDTSNNVYVSVTGDALTDVMVKMPFTGNGPAAPAVAASWKVPAAAEANVDENNNGQIIYSYQANVRIMVAPSDAKRVYTTATNLAADTYYYASEADIAGNNPFGANVDSLPFRFFGRYYVLVGAGEKLYKIKDTDQAADDPADWKEPGGQAGGKNGAVTDSDWDNGIAIKGAITSRCMIWGEKIYFGTREGYCYAVNFKGRSDASSDDATAVGGYPYHIPNQRVTDVFILSDGVYFVTDQGYTVKMPLQ